MIDIVCPSCEARYRLPEGAIGENGRRVSCSACGHGWLAYPNRDEEPLELGPEAAADHPAAKPGPGPAAEPGSRPKPQVVEGGASPRNPFAAFDADQKRSAASNRSEAEAKDEERRTAAYKAFAAGKKDAGSDEEDEDDSSPRPAAAQQPGADPRLSEDRAKQMAEIRSMLNEIKREPDGTPSTDREKKHEEVAPQRPATAEERDPLREKLEQYKHPGSRSGEARASRPTEDETKERGRRGDEKRGSGTALTGFLLIVLVVSIMASVYLLHPLIIAKVPEAEPAIRDYVATMDAFRLWVAEQVEALQATIEGLIDDDQA